MEAQRFTGTIERSGSKVILILPFDPNTVWGAKDKHHITGMISGNTYRGPLGSDGGRYFLSLGNAWRRDNGLEVGSEVEVLLSPEGPQSDALAQDVLVALNDEP